MPPEKKLEAPQAQPAQSAPPLIQTISTPPTQSAATTVPVPPQSHGKRNFLITLGVLLVCVLLGVGGWVYYQNSPQGILSSLLKSASTVTSYEGAVIVKDSTKSTTSEGVITADVTKKASWLKLEPNESKMETEVISVGDISYIKVFTTDPETLKIMTLPDAWLMIDTKSTSTSSSIIKNETVTDITQASDAWTLPKKEVVDGKELYTIFLTKRLSPDTVVVKEMSFDVATKMIYSLKVTSGELVTHITITKVNTSPSIEAPKNFLTQQEWDRELFIGILPKVKINNILVFRMKGVSEEEAEITKEAISEYYGVDASISPIILDPLPKTDAWYSAERKQYDENMMLGYMLTWFKESASSTRGILLTSDDMYSKKSASSTYTMSRALANSNSIVVSTSRMRANNASTSEAKKQLLEDRLTKTVVRSLGESVLLTLSSDAAKKECIFYQASTVEELDKVGKDACPIAKKGIPMLFGKKE